MTEEIEDPHKTEVAHDTGSRMLEIDSFERVVEGLKSASDGCRHLVARRENASWDRLADILDKTRVAVVRLAGMGRPADSDPTKRRKGEDTALPTVDAYIRVYNGLHAASAAARQLATGHRGDLRWSLYAAQLENLRDQTSRLVRVREGGTMH
jgi:hypothetical protein